MRNTKNKPYTEEQRKRRKNVLDILWIFLGILVAGIVIYILYSLYVWETTPVIERPFYRYAGINREEFNKECLFYLADGKSTFTCNHEEYTTDSTPLYLSDGSGIILQNDMIQVIPGEVNEYINCKALIEFSTSGDYKGFLYDGYDTYIFLQPVKLHFDTNEVELAAFSYVIIEYNIEFTVHSFDSDINTINGSDVKNVYTELNDGGRLWLTTDIIETKDGKRQLLKHLN